jgi:hypothetical protein
MQNTQCANGGNMLEVTRGFCRNHDMALFVNFELYIMNRDAFVFGNRASTYKKLVSLNSNK